MHIQSVEALKTWLTSRLEPICDADPAALSKYVVALVKKDKPVEELKAICIDQLEVFLSSETLEFVNVLFEALSNNSYLPTQIVETPAATVHQEKPRNLSVSEDPLVSKVLAEPSVPDDDDRDFKRTRKTTDTNVVNDVEIPAVSSGGDRHRKRRADSDENRGEPSKLVRDESGQARSSSASELEEQGGRNRSDSSMQEGAVYPILTSSRDRNSRHQDGRDFNSHGQNLFEDPRARRRSPPWDRRGRGRTFRGRDRYWDSVPPRHGDRIRDRVGRTRRERCRDYDEKGFCMRGELCVFDHGNDPVIVQDMAVLGFPGNPTPPPPFAPDRPPGPTPPGAVVPVPAGFPIPSTSQPPPPGTAGPKGDSQGEKNQDNSGPPNIPGSGVNTRPTGVPVNTGGPRMPMPPIPPPGAPQGRLMPPVSAIHQPRPPFVNRFEDSYNPEQPQFDRQPVWMRLGNPRPPAPPIGYNPAMLRPRELLPVNQAGMRPPLPPPQLIVQVPGKPNQANMPGVAERVVIPPVNEQPVVEAIPAPANNSQDSNRRPWQQRRSDTIELKKLPREFNNISKLNEYFQRFGSIINIQVSAFNNPEAALVQFSSHEEAKAAYHCPDAVLGNRFIRVFWYQPDRDRSMDSKGGPPKKPGFNHSKTATGKEENSDKPAAEVKTKPTMFQSGKTTFVKGGNSVTSSPAATSSSATPTTVSTKTVATPKHVLRNTEMMKKKLEIQKQKQELLKKQIDQQKLLISKLEKKNLSAVEKDLIMKTIKSLSSNIESLKQEVELAAMAAKSKESPTQARQIAQKAILDQELMLMTHQHSGEDTSELRKKVEELKQEAKSLGLLDPPGRGRGVTRGRGRGRGGGIGRPHPRVWTRESAVVDNRTKQVVVTEVSAEEKEDVMEHFREFGIVDRVENGKESTSFILTFRTRKEAEIAFFKGRKLKGKDLKVAWYLPPASPTAVVTSPTSVTVADAAAAKIEDDLGLDFDAELGKQGDEDEALLLGEDFDEEEEDEDERSWKRLF